MYSQACKVIKGRIGPGLKRRKETKCVTNLTTVLVNDGADVSDGVLEHAVGGRVGDHDASQLV